MKSFYVTLPGGVKSNYHENVLSDFVTHLPRTVELDGQWEVAIVEFHCTKSWYNVEGDSWVGIRDTKDRVDRNSMLIPGGTYSIQELVKVINDRLQSFCQYSASGDQLETDPKFQNPHLGNAVIVHGPSLTIDEFSKRVYINPGITLDYKLIFPDMTDELFQILGLSNRVGPISFYTIQNNEPIYDFVLENTFKSTREPIKGNLYGERAYDIERGIHAIYVYSDIVEENFIGDASARCLRVCTLPPKQFGETINLQFDQPHYIPVSSRSFHTIRITLKDQTNERIKFQFGDTLVKLHFRQNDV